MDLFLGNLQHKWEVWSKNCGADCNNLPGYIFGTRLMCSSASVIALFLYVYRYLYGFLSAYQVLSCDFQQASALLLFNSSDRLSYSEIMTQLNLSDDDVIRLLHSLSCAKYKILNKEPNTKTISSTDYFEFNSKFTDKMRRIKVQFS